LPQSSQRAQRKNEKWPRRGTKSTKKDLATEDEERSKRQEVWITEERKILDRIDTDLTPLEKENGRF